MNYEKTSIYDNIYRAIQFTCTSIACPEQYDALINGQIVGYLRLRHGIFTVTCPDVGGCLVLEADTIGDGMFDLSERGHFMDKARDIITEWVYQNKCIIQL
jgi:hypothetical protein